MLLVVTGYDKESSKFSVCKIEHNSTNITTLQQVFLLISGMTENVSKLPLQKDILIVFHAMEILIPEDRSNVTKLLSIKQAC